MFKLGYTFPQAKEVVDEILLAFANSVDFAFIVGGCLILVLVVIGIIFKVERPKDVDNEVLIPETEE
jgi:ABC-type dipeptide/oligopeptide/nickel transport system permease component